MLSRSHRQGNRRYRVEDVGANGGDGRWRVDGGELNAGFAENGLLYSSDLTTLLRVPAGATEVAIREGCTTIAAGALEACAKLTIRMPPLPLTVVVAA